MTTPNGKTLHRKNISKPITDFNQEHSNRENGPRGPDGRFTKSPSKQRRAAIIDSESEPEAPPMEMESPRTPEHSDSVTIKPGSFGRGRQKITEENRSDPGSPLDTPKKRSEGSLGPLTLCTDQMTDAEIHQAIRDTSNTDQELLLKDENGKVPVNHNTNLEDNSELSDLALASNLSSSTEIEEEITTEETKICADQRD